MKKILNLVFGLIAFPLSLHAWDEADHRLMTKLALENFHQTPALRIPCEVHPLSVFLEKLKPFQPELGNTWQFSNYLRINTKIDLSHTEPAVGAPVLLTPVEILSLYAADPDDGRDQDIFVRDEHGEPQYAFPDQKWFGVMTGPDSQAFRHLEKPPFDIRHPIDTLGLPFGKLGESAERAEIYYQLSQLAFSLGEDYWGWRFLAGSLHYLEDLHNPYHAGQITPNLLAKGLKALFDWGWKEKGFMGTLSHIVSNSHRFFETYVSNPHGEDHGLREEALAALKTTDVLPLPSSMQEMATQVRDASNGRFVELVDAVLLLSSPPLFSHDRFQSQEGHQADPSQFLQKGPRFETSNAKVFEVMKERFTSSGQVIRTAVQMTLTHRNNRKPEAILERLSQILPIQKLEE